MKKPGILGKYCALSVCLALALIACSGGGAVAPLVGSTDDLTESTPVADTQHWQLVEFFAVA